MEHLPDSIYFKDRESRFIRVNAAMSRWAGFPDPAALVGKSDFDLFTAEHARPAYEAEQRIITTGEPLLDFEEKETWPDGHSTWVSTTKLPLRDLAGAVIGTFGISHDITARKRAEAEKRELEAQLNFAQKLESVGRLSAGIAHEINTPGQFIADNLRFLSLSFQHLARHFAAVDALRTRAEALPQLQPELAALTEIEKEIELDFLQQEIPNCLTQSLDGMARISRIVGALKDFAHPHDAGRSPANLAHLIETAAAVSRHEWKYVAEFTTEFDPQLPPVPVLVDEFNQALLNLIINAAQAIAAALKQRGETKGRITARTRATPTLAIIEIEDTGTGIPEAARPHLFEPFFSTKGPGGGTGQGLHVVARIVHRHGGHIVYTSEMGRGTTFRLLLPLDAPPSAAPAPDGGAGFSSAMPSPPSGTGLPTRDSPAGGTGLLTRDSATHGSEDPCHTQPTHGSGDPCHPSP